MYLQHFGLQDYPFRLTPDTRYAFDHPGHREALNVVLVALDAGEGFIKVTGEVGTGKTLLCRRLLALLEERAVTAYLPNPHVNPNGLRLALAEELGLQCPRNLGQHRVMQLLRERLLELAADERPVVFIIDEAQAMPGETLEALRLISNLETEQRKLVHLVLLGQPELDQRLAGRKLRQLRQRISFSHQLQPLDVADVANYLRFRLQQAGHDGAPLFSRAAVRHLARSSRGVPRLVNILAHKALLVAFGKGASRVEAKHVLRAVADTDDARAPDTLPWLGIALGGLLVLSTAAGAVLASGALG